MTLPAILRERRAVSVFALLYYLVLIALGFVWGRTQVVFYVGFMALALAVVARVYSRVPLSPVAVWGLALWGLGHMIGGLVFVERDPVYEFLVGPVRFDKIVHVFGFGFAALASGEVLRARGLSEGAVPVLAALCGMGFGAINEMLEFLVTRISPTSNVGGFENAGWDLVANTAGAIAAALYLKFHRPAIIEGGAGRVAAAR